VLHERLVQSTYQPQALKPRVMESPSEAMEFGRAAVDALAPALAAPTGTAATPATTATTVTARATLRTRKLM